MYISRDHLHWVFPDKYSLKVGAAVRGFTFNIAPKVDDDFLDPSTGLINKESGEEEFILYQQRTFFLKKKRYWGSCRKAK